MAETLPVTSVRILEMSGAWGAGQAARHACQLRETVNAAVMTASPHQCGKLDAGASSQCTACRGEPRGTNGT